MRRRAVVAAARQRALDGDDSQAVALTAIAAIDDHKRLRRYCTALEVLRFPTQSCLVSPAVERLHLQGLVSPAADRLHLQALGVFRC